MTEANEAPNERSPLSAHLEDGAIPATSPTSSPASSQQAGDAGAEEVSNTYLALVLGSIWIGVVFTAIDTTVMATLLLPMTTDFRSLETLSWLGSSFLIAATAGIPLAGRLTDIFGRGAGAVLCNLVFTLGTLCGLASREWVLLLGRVLAGLGAGPLRTISSFVSSDLVPTRRRGFIQGLNLVCMGAGTAFGGFFGGWMNSLLGWKWAFLIQVPFLLLGTILVFFFVRIPRKTSDMSSLRRIDWIGCATLVASLVLLLTGLNAGGNLDSWSEPLVLSSTLLSALTFLTFIYNEHFWATEPILPLRLFSERTVSASCLTYFFGFMVSFGIIYFIPVYAQIMGKPSSQAGLQFIPQAMGNATGAVLAGALIRRTGRYMVLNYCSQACLIAASILIWSLRQDTPSWCPFAYLLLHGFGFGILLVVPFIALLSALPHADQAIATSALIALGSAGQTLGVTVSSAVFQNLLRIQLRQRLKDTHAAESIIERVRKSFGAIPFIDPAIRPSVERSFMVAVQGVFLLTLAISILAALSAHFIRQNKLHDTISRTDREDE